jgi:hypothetical protein
MKTRTLVVSCVVAFLPVISLAQNQDGTASEAEKNQTASGLESSLKEISQQLRVLGDQYSGLSDQISALKEQVTDLDRRVGEVERTKGELRKKTVNGNPDGTPQETAENADKAVDRAARERIEKHLKDISVHLGAIAGNRTNASTIGTNPSNTATGKEAVTDCCEKIERHLKDISVHLGAIAGTKTNVGTFGTTPPIREAVGWVRIINFTRRTQPILVNNVEHRIPANSEVRISVPLGTFHYRLPHETRRYRTIENAGEEQRVQITQPETVIYTQPETFIWDPFLRGYVRVGG